MGLIIDDTARGNPQGVSFSLLPSYGPTLHLSPGPIPVLPFNAKPLARMDEGLSKRGSTAFLPRLLKEKLQHQKKNLSRQKNRIVTDGIRLFGTGLSEQRSQPYATEDSTERDDRPNPVRHHQRSDEKADGEVDSGKNLHASRGSPNVQEQRTSREDGGLPADLPCRLT